MNRKPTLRASFEVMREELVVDNFAGGGGTSTGIEEALGRHADIAINHSPAAIAMHKANHPETKHYCENIWEVDPREACGSRPVGLAWFSPDCTHFSHAKGTVPLDSNIRGLAWVVIRWAEAVKPRIIVLENVEEFQTWGPLDENGRPDTMHAGETFLEWIGKLASLGYEVQFRTLVAADHGAPTTRKRFFLIARCDGAPIVWPEATHGAGRDKPWRAAAEIIDWSLPTRSIFGRDRPLAPATIKRIAVGLRRYVLEAADPFIIPGEPTIVEPFIVRHGHYSKVTGAGLRPGCGAGLFRGQSLSDPLATVCATNDKHLVAAFVTKHNGGPHGGAIGRELTQPCSTITARDQHALSAAWLMKYYGSSKAGVDVRQPMPTILAGGGKGGGHLAAVQALLHKHAPKAEDNDTLGLIRIGGVLYAVVDVGMRMLQPHELFAAQGFPSWYNIRPEFNGKPMTKTLQTKLVGNSVCPPVARDIVQAQWRSAA